MLAKNILTDGLGDYDSRYTQEAIDNNIIVYTIGLGSGVDSDLLTDIAEATGGKYYFATEADELLDIFKEVSLETIDFTTDTNNDGISDYFTKLICDGTLVLSNGSDEINYPGASTQALCSAPTSPLTALAFRSCSRKRESGVCEFVCLCFYI